MDQLYFIFSSGYWFASFRRWFLFALCLGLVGVASAAGLPRERQLFDNGWRFRLGDPADIALAGNTNVAYYPEISYIPKLQSGEVSGNNSETYMGTLRVDPVASHMGEAVSVVQTNFNDSTWRQLNLPHDWVVELPFDSNAAQNHGYKSGITDGSTSTNAVGWYRRTFTIDNEYCKCHKLSVVNVACFNNQFVTYAKAT